MRTLMQVSLAALLILVGAESAQAQMIDAFDRPPAPIGGLAIFSATPSDPVQLATMANSGAMGGNRGVFGERQVIFGDSNAVNYEIGGQQQFRVVNATSGTAGARLLYGFGAFTNGNAAQDTAVQSGNYSSISLPEASLDRAFDPAGAFAFEYQNRGIATQVQVAIVTGRDEGNAATFSSSSFVLPMSTSDTTFSIPFASFAGASASTFGDIDQIVFSFTQIPANTVFALDNLRATTPGTAVPEASGLASLAMLSMVGIGGWVWRRRRASRGGETS
jgi:hypothetical protein